MKAPQGWRVIEGGLGSVCRELYPNGDAVVARREPTEPKGIDADWEIIEKACHRVELASRFEPREINVHIAGFCWNGDDLKTFVRGDERLPWWRRLTRWWRRA